MLSAVCSLLTAICSLLSALKSKRAHGRIELCSPEWLLIYSTGKFLKYGRQSALCRLLSPVCSLLTAICSLLSALKSKRAHGRIELCSPEWLLIYSTGKFLKYGRQSALCRLLTAICCSLLSALKSKRAQKPSNRGRPRSTSIAEIIDKIVYVCRTGCQWRSKVFMDITAFELSDSRSR